MGSRILTSHAGSLPRPDELIDLNRRRGAGEAVDEAAYAQQLQDATVDVVRKQRELGIDLPNDGEYGHAMGQKVDYGAWWSYIFGRLGGLGLLTDMTKIPVADPKETIKIGTLMDRRDWHRFADAYFNPENGIMASMRADGEAIQDAFQLPVCDGPLVYVGQDEVQRDIANLKAAMEATGTEQAFMCSIGPASCSRIGNTHYKTDEEFVWACAEAMREEYLAITNAGIIVQLDEPSFAESWDQFTVEPTLEEYRKFTMVRIEALNHALRGIPRELVRFHCCWGSWHGPHSTDMELAKIVDLLVQVEAGSYSFEAANARHEHEWRVWEDVRIPDDVILVPGVVGHATNVIEHPQLVADRIERFARIVGPDRVIAATDCGLGGRVHPQIAWAKLEALTQGAELASGQLVA
ncbi:MAG: 5-methyltetrahydropteroyltriglutamate--homocysteine methyltransferase [Solirubrobacteraceae bacterium]|jgi:5-methyltetrahydropteroyltriglutamate--homocysteine methyltransferase|nr:5-methyltetrahydropteroyltriglutamate--homocysteine methyltransferase [Solirubrobacteraceae bacterium]